MNLPAETNDSQEESFFRCPVQAEKSQGIIRVGRRKARATIQETSIDGFTVLVSPRDASKLKVGRPWVLEHDDTRIEVHPQWIFNAPDGHIQMGLRRLRDLTPPEPIQNSLLARFGGTKFDDPSYSSLAFGGFVLFLFSLMALPGLGDQLGTSTRIQDTLRWVINGLDQSFGQYL
jgi:hypothetical protein